MWYDTCVIYAGFLQIICDRKECGWINRCFVTFIITYDHRVKSQTIFFLEFYGLMGEAYPFGGMRLNWYAVQVRGSYEQRIANKCRNAIDQDILFDCVIPQYIYKKKYLGLWHEERDILFPGYIFMITDQVELLNVALRRIPDFVRIIGKKQMHIYPLEEEEVNFIRRFGKEAHIVEMSEGYVEGDRIYITKGPLRGREGSIVKVDRHKRLAYLRLNMFQKELTAKVGLEIISKCS